MFRVKYWGSLNVHNWGVSLGLSYFKWFWDIATALQQHWQTGTAIKWNWKKKCLTTLYRWCTLLKAKQTFAHLNMAGDQNFRIQVMSFWKWLLYHHLFYHTSILLVSSFSSLQGTKLQRDEYCRNKCKKYWHYFMFCPNGQKSHILG